MGFIERITDRINPEALHSLRQEAYVFPTQRAGLYFRKCIASRFRDRAFMAPAIMTIEEFIASVSGHTAANETRLLFELYDVYRTFDSGMPLDRFYAWGTILLSDFDDIDRNLVEPGQLYRNLQQLQDLEETFANDKETLEAIRQFQKVLTEDRRSELIERFRLNWERIGKVYTAFQEVMEKKAVFYEGLLYRKAEEKIREDPSLTGYKRVHFCGFNALTRSEEAIFDILFQADQARLYWDADRSYLEDDRDEAGFYLRRYRKRWKGENSIWIISEANKNQQNIRVLGAAKSTAQVKLTGSLLREMNSLEEDTAVILADENLLTPLLYSLPDSCAEVNVTMGYPLRFSSLFSFLRNYFNLILHASGKEDPYFKGSDVIDLLSNPVIQAASPGSASNIQEIIEDNRKWLKRSHLTQEFEGSVFAEIIQYPEKADQLPDHLMKILVRLFYVLKDNDHISRIELEFDYHFLRHIQRLTNQIGEHLSRLDAEFLYRIYRESLISARVPFSGEPVKGLQVMGFLESRLLDFDRVILLSVNEGKLPATHRKYTYIPYAIRKAFKMPTFEQTDKIFSYHFKRLLQRAREISILYDTEVGTDGSGGRSRYIEQILQANNDGTTPVRHQVYTSQLNLQKDEVKIRIPKSSQIMDVLDRYIPGKTSKTRYLGPTLLTDYLDCSLRFYFKHIAGIREPEELSEEMDAREFGNVVHDTLEYLYSPFVGKWVSSQDIQQIRDSDRLAECVDKAMVENKLAAPGNTGLEGRDLLNKSIIQKLADRVLAADEKDAPFRIESLEQSDRTYQLDTGEGFSILMGGKIDRLDTVKERDREVLRVVDYKTGKAEMVSPSATQKLSPDEYVQLYFKDGKYKAGFQTYYYGLILQRDAPDSRIKAGIYSLKEVNRGIRFLRNGQRIDPEIFNEYEQRLRSMILDLYDTNQPFEETDDHSKCEWCPFNAICRTQ